MQAYFKATITKSTSLWT